jgi:hypothetical protein
VGCLGRRREKRTNQKSMNEKKRKANETEFDSWTENDKGGRIYHFEISGKLGWKAKYLKEVDKDEITIRFWQEIYDEKNMLQEIHEKYPIDNGHKKVDNDN